MASATRPPPLKPLDIELTIVSAKHLKNVNWRNGDLKPYAVFWVDPDRRLSTRSDDSGSTRPVWNERFTLPLHGDSVLTLEIFHSRPSETPKPLVGTLRVELKDLHDPDNSTRIRTYFLLRPSGRPQGKILLKIGLRERPLPPPPPQVYHPTPPPSYYYGTAPLQYPPRQPYISVPRPPPPPVSPPPTSPPAPYSTVAEYFPYSSYYYSSQPPMLPRPGFGGSSSYEGPSAPVDYSPYDQKPRGGGKMGFGVGLGAGSVAGAMGSLALDEGLKYEEEKMGKRVEREVASRDRDDYSDYHPHHHVDY